MLFCKIYFKMPRLLCCLLSLACLTTNAVYLTTTPIRHKTEQLTSLIKDVESCISRDKYSTPRDMYLKTFICIDRGISHCLWNNQHHYSADQLFLPNRITYCGIMASTRSKHNIWTASFERIHVIVAQNKKIHLQFLIFNFEWVQYECEAHGIVVLVKPDINMFCGKRLPWILLTTGHTAQIAIRALWNKNYNFRITYSHYEPQWSMTIYKKYSRFEEFILPELVQMTILIVGYDFYLLTAPDETMQIDMGYQYIKDINIIFYDGPGEKSDILLEISDAEHSNKTSVLTTAYLAMIRFNRLTNFTIKMIQLWSIGIMCAMNNTDNTINIQSTPSQPIRCGQYSQYTNIERYAILHIYNLSFSGPLILDGEKNINCQYGGLFVVENSGYKNQYICENRHNFNIYSDKTNFIFFLVWYPGYSLYSLEAYFMTSSCLGQYTPFVKSLTSSIAHPFIVTDLFHCQIIICTPAITKERSAFCRISISGSDGPVGTAAVLVKQAYSLKQCFDYATNNAKFHIRANYTVNWPFGKPRSMLVSRKSFEQFYYFFLYLNNMTAVFPYVCSESDTHKQLAIRIQIPTCKIIERATSVNSINQVYSLTAECSDFRHSLIFNFENNSNDTNYNKQLNVFQKEGRIKHVGRYINVVYGKCPVDCRNFTYTLLILDKDKQLIYKYTSPVGAHIFTGYFYHGLKLSITRPLETCGRHPSCEISYSFYKPHYNVGRYPTKRVVDRQTRKWHFNQRRYVMF